MPWNRITGGFEWYGDGFPLDCVEKAIKSLREEYQVARSVCSNLQASIETSPIRVSHSTIAQLSKWTDTQIIRREELSRDIFICLFGSYPPRLLDQNNNLLPDARKQYPAWANSVTDLPPVDPPPVDLPPVDPPPVDLPPVDLPPVDLPPVDLPPVDRKPSPKVTGAINISVVISNEEGEKLGIIAVSQSDLSWTPHGRTQSLAVSWSRVCSFLESQVELDPLTNQDERDPFRFVDNEHIMTKPLPNYSSDYQQLAKQVFDRISLDKWHYEDYPIQARNGKKCEHKGSYSICSRSGDGETLGKIVIYQKRDLQREEGVYIWLRKNGIYTCKIDVHRFPTTRQFDNSQTMSVAPHPDEDFQVLRITEATDEIVDLLTSLGEI